METAVEWISLVVIGILLRLRATAILNTCSHRQPEFNAGNRITRSCEGLMNTTNYLSGMDRGRKLWKLWLHAIRCCDCDCHCCFAGSEAASCWNLRSHSSNSFRADSPSSSLKSISITLRSAGDFSFSEWSLSAISITRRLISPN